MISNTQLNKKLQDLEDAIFSFETLLAKDISFLDLVLQDGVRKGMAQSFEYCSELLWKAGKAYLESVHGVQAASPKEVFRSLLSSGVISPEECEQCLEMVDERNELSHIYSKKHFEKLVQGATSLLGA